MDQNIVLDFIGEASRVDGVSKRSRWKRCIAYSPKPHERIQNLIGQGNYNPLPAHQGAAISYTMVREGN
jgi:hypothetical protein